LTQKSCNTFKIALERLFNKDKILSEGLHSHELTNLIQSALESNPKLFWKELQTRNIQTKNNIITYQWFEYAKKLYEKDQKVDRPAPPLVNTTTKLFTEQEIEVGIKMLGFGKEKYLVELQA
jgi:hypothetical protein